MADTTPPTIAITSNKTLLKAGDSATLTFTLSEPSNNFIASDVTVSGGTLSNFVGNGTTYTAVFTPTPDSVINGIVSVANGVFSDFAGNLNASSSAVKLWTRLFGSSGFEFGNALTTGLDGSIYVSGVTNGAFDGQANNGSNDAFVTKYSPDGSKVWTRLLGTPSYDSGNALTTGLDGSIYVSGYKWQAFSNGMDAFVTKYSPDGTKVWTRLLGTSSGQ